MSEPITQQDRIVISLIDRIKKLEKENRELKEKYIFKKNAKNEQNIQRGLPKRDE